MSDATEDDEGALMRCVMLVSVDQADEQHAAGDRTDERRVKWAVERFAR